MRSVLLSCLIRRRRRKDNEGYENREESDDEAEKEKAEEAGEAPLVEEVEEFVIGGGGFDKGPETQKGTAPQWWLLERHISNLPSYGR